jgi:hypothetical protein
LGISIYLIETMILRGQSCRDLSIIFSRGCFRGNPTSEPWTTRRTQHRSNAHSPSPPSDNCLSAVSRANRVPGAISTSPLFLLIAVSVWINGIGCFFPDLFTCLTCSLANLFARFLHLVTCFAGLIFHIIGCPFNFLTGAF